jgi:LacI family transcriptional regulator
MAVRFIAEHATEGLTVEKVADAIPLSRRTLERRFRHALGESILDHIRGAQVERSKRLLGDSAIPLSKVARVSGFTSVKAMNAIFSRVAGTTPLGYRKSIK